MKTLVTFLGRGKENKDTGYRETTYEFPNGSKERTAFFGLALAKKQICPDCVVILGTSGSQWSVLVENFAVKDEEEEARLKLIDAEIGQKVKQDMLDRIAGLMSKAVGIRVVPCLIPFGKSESEQYEILNIIAEKVPEGTVSLDLTHGFRHFGMIGFLSAFMLEYVHKLVVSDLWYGALDMTSKSGITPVLKLDGLDRVKQWINALERFDATGDYSVFTPLLIADGVADAECLKDAAFYERTHNLSKAMGKIHTVLPKLKNPLLGAAGLFQDQLCKRLAWVNLGSLSKKQRTLANQYLDRRDYVRAATFGWEALITLQCETQGYDLKDPNKRQEAREEFRNSLTLDQQKKFDSLNQIRNALAHGTSPTHGNRHIREKCEEMLGNEQKLREGLKAFLTDL